MAPRVFWLGLDGLSPKSIADFNDRERLPYFAEALEDGRVRALNAPFPGGPAAWWSAVTGVNPGWHGRFGGREAPQATPAAPLLETDAIPSTWDWFFPEATLDDLEADCVSVEQELAAAVERWRKRDERIVLARPSRWETLYANACALFDVNRNAFDRRVAERAAVVVHRALSAAGRALCDAAQAAPGALIVVLSAWAASPTQIDLPVDGWLADRGYLAVDEKGDIDWTKTSAYVAGPFVRLNLRGREQDGTVDEGKQAQDVSREIAAGLAEWVDPLRRTPVLRRVYRADELYSGDAFFHAPDLFPEPYPGYRVRGGGPPGTILGAHAGTLLMSKVMKKDRPTALDLHATIAARLDVPRHRYAEGEDLLT